MWSSWKSTNSASLQMTFIYLFFRVSSTLALTGISDNKFGTAWLGPLGLFQPIFIFCLTHKSRTDTLLKKRTAKRGGKKQDFRQHLEGNIQERVKLYIPLFDLSRLLMQRWCREWEAELFEEHILCSWSGRPAQHVCVVVSHDHFSTPSVR